MPRIVALDWDDQEVRLVVAQQQAKELTIEALVAVPLAAASDAAPSSGRDAAQVIRAAVAEHRARHSDAIVAVRRGEVELRPLKLPPVPPEELPEIVRFQALREFSELAEDWPIDFYPVDDASTEETTVLAAAISPTRLAEFQRITEQAELKLRCLVLRPCAAAVLLPHASATTDAEVQLMVDVFGGAIELTVLREQTAVFMRTVQPPASENPTGPEWVSFVTSEIRRTILAVRNQLGGHPVQRIVLFGAGADHEEFCRQLQERSQLQVQLIDPLQPFRLGAGLQQQSLNHSGRFAAALGMLLEQARGQRPAIDFLHPRRVAPPKSRRLLLAGIGGAAGFVALCALTGYWWHLRTLDQNISQLQAQLQQGTPNVKAAEQRIAETSAVQQWLKGDINWLEQLRDVSRQLPPADRTRVEEWRASVTAAGDGLLVLEGVVDEQGTIAEIENQLRDQRRRVRGEGGTYERQDEKYPWRFKETVTITTNDPTQPPATPATKPPTARAASRGAPQ